MKIFISFAGFMEKLFPLLAPKESPVFTGNPTTTTPNQFDSSANVPSTTFVQKALGNMSGAEDIPNANTVLTNTAFGKSFICSSATAPRQHTLPSLASIPIGATIEIVNYSGHTVSVATATGDQFISATNPTGTGTIDQLKHGLSMKAMKDKTNRWRFYGTNDLVATTGAFASSISLNGWQKLPSGEITQWGRTADSLYLQELAVNFPIVFPTAVFSLVLGADTAVGSGGRVRGYSTKSTLGFNYNATNIIDDTRHAGYGADYIVKGN